MGQLGERSEVGQLGEAAAPSDAAVPGQGGSRKAKHPCHHHWHSCRQRSGHAWAAKAVHRLEHGGTQPLVGAPSQLQLGSGGRPVGLGGGEAPRGAQLGAPQQQCGQHEAQR